MVGKEPELSLESPAKYQTQERLDSGHDPHQTLHVAQCSKESTVLVAH